MPNSDLDSLPDHATVYVPGFGETTLGAIRASGPPDMDENAATIAMWGYIVTHPDAKPWKTGWPPRGVARV
jgi:hypothetical protein